MDFHVFDLDSRQSTPETILIISGQRITTKVS